MRILKFTSSILLLFLVNISLAQKAERDYKPSAIRVGANAFGLLQTAYKGDFTRIEGQMDIDLHHMFFVMDLGYEKNLSSSNDFNYENKGSYYRIGIQANIQPYNENRNVLFFGLRYARASFKDKLDFTNSTDLFGNTQFSLVNDNLRANWLELNMGMKVKIAQQLYFGYTIHFKFGQAFSGNGELTPSVVPGFGKSNKSSAAGFSYYIAYRIPFRDKPIPIRPKKELKKIN